MKSVFRPHRAVVREGAVSRCPGVNQYNECDPTLPIDAPVGTSVYSTAAGLVVAVADDFVHIATRNEPVVLYYNGVSPTVVEGQYVGRGQTIGTSKGRVYFGVQQFVQGGGVVNVEPSSWLAARGNRIAARYTGSGGQWCEQKRHISVPRSAGAPCQFYEPDRAAFALLPVTIEVER
ncbi:MAG TPA: M23 family metallopeptidase [Longimicrobiales bacterium]|nr:M23 family metallopeptidase [Longimicrobiales bacterium]